MELTNYQNNCPKTIMIVDDDKYFLTEISELLRACGYKTAVFSDGSLAVEKILEIKPDVILLDLNMNGKNGFRIADELRRHAEIGDISIIAVTGFYTGKKYQVFMKLCGIKRCLLKPFNPLDMIAAIENISPSIN